jgi:uncharacterized protein YodC (DUF2158 family)
VTKNTFYIPQSALCGHVKKEKRKGEKMTFKIGDIVQLKSGGPLMTITSLPEPEMGTTKYGCNWFNGKKIEYAGFIEEILQESEKK